MYNDYYRKWGNPTPVDVSPQLNTLSIDDVFDFTFGMDAEHHKFLTELFYARYGHRQLGTLFKDTFKNWLRAKFFELWSLKYRKLYETAGMVKYPFVNSDFRTNAQSNKQTTSKASTNTKSGSGTSRASTFDNFGSQKAQSYDNGIGYASSRNESVGSAASESKTQDKSKSQSSSTDNFLDAPQTKNAKELWSDGYLTTASRQSQSQAGANTNHNATGSTNKNEGQDNSITGSSSDHHDTSSTQSGGGSRDYTNQSNTGVSTAYSSTLSGDTDATHSVGFSGVSATALLVEWRESFIPIDHMFLNEFEELFLGVF